jgi:hypothetical protein
LSDEYKLRWFREEDLSWYIDGLNKALWSEYNEKVFNWKFRDNPFGLGFTSIAVAEHVPTGIPVAFNSFLPMEVRLRDEFFTVFQGCDGFVDEGHRRQGLFQRTIRFMVEEMGGLGPELLIGFNLVEAAEAAHKAGSSLTYDLDKCTLSGGAFYGLRDTSGVELEPISVDECHRLYESWAEDSELLHFNRSLKCLRWRIEGNPVRQIQPYRLIRREGPESYVVVDEVEEEEHHYLTVNDYPPGQLDDVLPGVLACLNRLHTGITSVEVDTLRGNALEKASNRIGFTAVPWLKVIMKPINSTDQRGEAVYRGDTELSDVQRWHLAPSDIF